MAMEQRSERGRRLGISAFLALLLGVCAGLVSDFIFRVVFDDHGHRVVLVSLWVMVIVMVLTEWIGRLAADRSGAKSK
jgi:hypothetical protein